MAVHILSTFYGLGKTTLVNILRDFDITQDGKKYISVSFSDVFKLKDHEVGVIDLDSSDHKTDFPNEYISIIERIYKSGKNVVILCSTHPEVHQLLKKRSIPFTLIYPSKNIKDEIITRITNRGTPPNLLKIMTENFDSFQNYCEETNLTDSKIEIDDGGDGLDLLHVISLYETQ